MTPAPIVAWLHAIMLTVSPPASWPSPDVAFPGWAETAQERDERYEDIAAAAAEVAHDQREAPVLGSRAETAVLLLAVAFHESGYARDVDLGPCYRGKDGKGSRCDAGLASCLVQVRLGAGRTREGWTAADLFADRRKCFRVGLRQLRQSANTCMRLEHLDRSHALDAYASGSCGSPVAHKRSLEILSIQKRMLAAVPRPEGL